MLTPLPTNYANFYTNSSGHFAPPTYGGAEGVVFQAFTFANTTALTWAVLPAGAVIVGFSLFVNTVFSGGTATLSVGHTGSATYYLNAQSVLGTAGPVTSTTWAVNAWYVALPTPETLTLTVGASNNAGAGVLSVRYVLVS